MKKLIIGTSLCSLAVFLSGCASLICGPTQSISVKSKPSGAEVTVYNVFKDPICKQTTPCVVKLDRRNEEYKSAQYQIVIAKEGYAPVTIDLTGSVNRAYLANILYGGIGFAIDPITGAMWTLSPDEIDTKLVASESAFFGKEKGLFVCLKDQVPPELQPYLKRSSLAD